MEKSELLTQLYTLRAGLSFLSQICDSIKNNEESLKKNEYIISQVNVNYMLSTEAYNKAKSDLRVAKKALKHIEAKCTPGTPEYTEAIQQKEIEEERFKKSIKEYKIQVIQEAKECEPFWGKVERQLIAIWLTWFLYIPFRMIIVNAKRRKYIKERVDDYIRSHYVYQESLEEKKRRCLEILEKAQEKCHAEEKKYQSKEQKYQSEMLKRPQVSEDLKVELKSLGDMCMQIYKSLQTEFDSFLAESDWRNIDLLIYYLESGRADSLKEALIQLDKQKQTDQIVKAIHEAADSISRTISSSIERLGQNMQHALTKLGNRIDYHFERNQAALLHTNNEIIHQNKLLSAQISETALNNALIEKSTRSSEQLLKDIIYTQKYWVK